jgi:hypothetical protein
LNVKVNQASRVLFLPLIMNTEQKSCENGDEKNDNEKRFQRHLQVNSVGNPTRKEVDWNRNAHSSPVKGYRRESEGNQVCISSCKY